MPTMRVEQTESTPCTSVKEDGGWITDGAWITGLAGVVVLFLMAILCHKHSWFDRGVSVFGFTRLDRPLDVKLFCLIVIALSMCFAEVIRLTVSGHKKLFSFAPELTEGQYGRLICMCAWRYICYLAIFCLAIFFYKAVPEYGIHTKSQYYIPWLRMCQWLFTAFLWLGFPYVLLTYALKYDKKKDINSYHHLVQTLVITLLMKIKIAATPKNKGVSKKQFKKTFLGLFVRVFFAPLMTVFFIDQYTQLVLNVTYLFDSLPRSIIDGNYTHVSFNTDLFNISKSVIFSIDVSLAWCGYVMTSRWIDNETQSVDPTLQGWFVCLISYPPLTIAGFYFVFPSEGQLINIDNNYFVTLFTVLMILSFSIYTLSTLVFGVRFSNLTHRGIIRTGPFAYIRHPAYTSKNIGWWLGIFPVLLYFYIAGESTFSFLLISTIALIAQSYWYYLRAVTEERHLLVDPAYRKYCALVKYRFIPGVL